MSNTTFIIHFPLHRMGPSRIRRSYATAGCRATQGFGLLGCERLSGSRRSSSLYCGGDLDSRPDHEQHIAGLVADGAWDRLSGLLRSEPSSSYFDSV